MKYPNKWNLEDIMSWSNSTSAHINGKWVPARPLGFPSMFTRIKYAWLVFTGKGDVIIWPEGQ